MAKVQIAKRGADGQGAQWCRSSRIALSRRGDIELEWEHGPARVGHARRRAHTSARMKMLTDSPSELRQSQLRTL